MALVWGVALAVGGVWGWCCVVGFMRSFLC